MDVKRLQAVVIGLLLTAAAATGGALAAPVPLSLDEALRLATARAEAVVDAAHAVEAAEVALAREQESFGTRISLSGRANLSDRGVRFRPVVSGSGALGPAVSWSATSLRESDGDAVISVSVQLWPPARDSAAVRNLQNAQSSLESARDALGRARAQAVVSTVEAYRQYQLAVARLALAEAELDAAREAYARTEAGVAAGRTSRSALIQAEITVLQSEERVASAAARVESAKVRLARLVGLAPDEFTTDPFDEEHFRAEERHYVVPDREAYVAEVVANSADVAARELAWERAQEGVARARRDWGLGLSLSASVESSGGDAVDWMVGLTGTYALADAGARRNALRAAELELARAERELERARKAAAEEARTAIRTLESALRAFESASAVERLRRLDLEVAREALRLGSITERELGERQRALDAAVLDAAEAALNVRLAAMRLALLKGEAPSP